MLANGKKEPAQVLWKAGRGEKDGQKVQALRALAGRVEEVQSSIVESLSFSPALQ